MWSRLRGRYVHGRPLAALDLGKALRQTTGSTSRNLTTRAYSVARLELRRSTFMNVTRRPAQAALWSHRGAPGKVSNCTRSQTRSRAIARSRRRRSPAGVRGWASRGRAGRRAGVAIAPHGSPRANVSSSRGLAQVRGPACRHMDWGWDGLWSSSMRFLPHAIAATLVVVVLPSLVLTLAGPDGAGWCCSRSSPRWPPRSVSPPRDPRSGCDIQAHRTRSSGTSCSGAGCGSTAQSAA